MKNILFTLALALFVLAGCTEEMDNSNSKAGEVEFSAAVDTRATLDGTWEDGDQVGIYNVIDGSAQVSNAMYTVTPSNGALTPSNDKAKIFIPAGKSVDIYAYSPYSSSKVSGTTYKIDLTDQSTPEKVQAADLMLAKAENQTEKICALKFKHMLARIDIELTAVGNVTNLHDFEMTLNGWLTGDFDLSDGVIDFPSTKKGTTLNLNPVFKDNAHATITALLLPLWNSEVDRRLGSLCLKDKSGKLLTYVINIADDPKFNRVSCKFDVGDKEPLPPSPTDEVQYVQILPNTFTMGSPEGQWERDQFDWVQHKVSLKGFYISRYEITAGQYAKFLQAVIDYYEKHDVYYFLDFCNGYVSLMFRPSQFPPRLDEVVRYCYGIDWFDYSKPYNITRICVKPEYANYPMNSVTWEGARRYAEWAGGKLPTEAQWEYACRRNTMSVFPFGNDEKKLDEYSVYGVGALTAVGTKKPNDFGLYDMLGNVSEWCLDGYEPSERQKSDAAVDPLISYSIPGSLDYNEVKITRGGAYNSSAKSCRSASVLPCFWLSAGNNIGFRIVKDKN